jgi:hypothetical protein
LPTAVATPSQMARPDVTPCERQQAVCHVLPRTPGLTQMNLRKVIDQIRETCQY